MEAKICLKLKEIVGKVSRYTKNQIHKVSWTLVSIIDKCCKYLYILYIFLMYSHFDGHFLHFRILAHTWCRARRISQPIKIVETSFPQDPLRIKYLRGP